MKTKADFFRWAEEGMSREEEHIIVYQDQGVAQAWCHYFVVEEAQQLGLCSFVFSEENLHMLRTWIDYLTARYPAYEFRLYFPKENRSAHRFLSESYPCIDQSFVDVLSLNNTVDSLLSEKIVPITEENVSLFAQLLGKVPETGWDIEQFRGQLDRWSIFVAVEAGVAIEVVFTSQKNEQIHEIFGLISLEESLSVTIKEALLQASIQAAKDKHADFLYFFTDQEDHLLTQQLGFSTLTEATCYKMAF